jgi:hypothetical protein
MARKFLGCLAAAALAALSLSACVESRLPLIANAQPVLGQQFEVHLYEDFVDNKASGVHASVYRWQDGEYVRVSGLARDAKRFVAQPLAGNDFLIQSSDESKGAYLYWIGRKLAPGVYLVFGVDEADADETTRKEICGVDRPDGVCWVSARDELIMLARATAAKQPKKAALGVVMSRPVGF